MTRTHVMVRPIWALVVIASCLLLTTAAGIFYTNHMQKQADHRWCAILNLAAGAPTNRPPGITDDEWQRRLAGGEELRKLRISLGC